MRTNKYIKKLLISESIKALINVSFVKVFHSIVSLSSHKRCHKQPSLNEKHIEFIQHSRNKLSVAGYNII